MEAPAGCTKQTGGAEFIIRSVSALYGWILEWFEKDGDGCIDRVDVEGVDVPWLQQLFGEPSVDDMMCLSYTIDGTKADELQSHVPVRIDLSRFDYFLSGWSQPGFRTPGGMYPPPKDPPVWIKGAVRIRPSPRHREGTPTSDDAPKS
jgi:hypothetical protein